MREIFTIALNDLQALFRQRGTLLTVFVVPVAMTIVLGLAFGGSSGQITIDVLRPDVNDPSAAKFVDLLRTEGGKNYVVCDLANAAAQVSDCKLSDLKPGADLRTTTETRVTTGTVLASLVLPAQFDATIHGQQTTPATIEFIEKNGLNAPQAIHQTVDAVVNRLNGSILAARVITDKAQPAADQKQSFYDSTYAAADQIWANNPVVIQEQTNLPEGTSAGGGFGQSSPGMGAMFVMLNALGLATIFIQERQTGTIQRLLVLPLAKWQILAGKLLGRYVLGLLVFAVMIIVGTLFKVPWGDWLGVIVTVLVFTLAVTAMALAFSTLVRTVGQATGLAMLVSLTLAPLGGAWWPISIVPVWMQTLGKISPIAWSQDAFSKLIFYGGHLVDILPSLGVLLLFAAVFFAIGVSRFRYE